MYTSNQKLDFPRFKNLQILRINSFLIIFAGPNFCEIDQNSLKSRSLIRAKINSIKVIKNYFITFLFLKKIISFGTKVTCHRISLKLFHLKKNCCGITGPGRRFATFYPTHFWICRTIGNSQ